MRALLAPRFWPAHLVTVAAVVAAIGLANWQFGVWKVNRAADAYDPSKQAAVALDSLVKPGDTLRGKAAGRPVIVTGRWRAAPNTYISGHTNNGAGGFWVVGLVDTSSGVLPVVVGWSPTASAAQPTGAVSLTGVLEPSDDGGSAADAPPVLSSLSVPRLTQFVSGSLYPGYVIANDPTSGLAPVVAPRHLGVSWDSGLRNFLYGLQWWLFAGLFVYMWWRWCRDQINGAGQGQVASSP